jgi:hypothetical protein
MSVVSSRIGSIASERVEPAAEEEDRGDWRSGNGGS